ncbi:MAG TPA: PQQ-binding-like beta-propeller repeat protein [Armatimonadota bacterium]
MRQRHDTKRRSPLGGRRFTAWGAAVAWGLLLLVAVGGWADWPMFAGGPLHLGVGASGPGASLTELGRSALGSSVDSSPAVVGGRVYVGTADGDLCCLDAAGGAVQWRYHTDGAVVSSPAVADGRVVFGSVDRYVYCLAADSGQLLWKYRTWKPVVGSPATAGGVAFVGGVDGTFLALDLATGAVRWQADDQAEISGHAAVAGEAVLYGDRGGVLHARRVSDGTVLWSVTTRSPIVGGPTVVGNTVLVPYMSYTALVPPKVEYLVAYDLATGVKLWALTGVVSVFSTPAVADGVTYFATVEGYLSATELHAVRVTDGLLLWKRGLPPLVAAAPVLDAEFVYVGAGDGAMYCLNRADGAVRARVPLAKKIYSSAALSDGRLFVGANDGALHCLGVPAAVQ